jgi:hypothetical protein
MNYTRSLRPSIVRTCLILLGLSAGSSFVSDAAVAPTKCPTGQVYNAATKKCGTAPVPQPKSSKIPTLPKAKLPPPPPQPNISSINPRGGPAGTEVTIHGTGFGAGATVSVGDAQLGMAQATKVAVVNPMQITAVVPPGRSLSTNFATMVNVQVTVAGQTSKAILFSYCSNVTEYDPAQNKCVPLPPTCGQNCPPASRIPAPPLACPDGQIAGQVAGQLQCIPQPAGTFAILQFIIGTGGDDLQAGDKASVRFSLPDGSPYTCLLHDSDTWSNNSTHTAECFLHDKPMTLAQLRNNSIVISYVGNGTPVITPFETQIQFADNWNLQSVTVNAYNQGQPATCVFSASGDPLFRFTNSAPSVVITDFPNGC